MQKAAVLAPLSAQPGLTGRFKQYEGTEDIGLDEDAGPDNTAINMRFGGKMNNSVEAFLGKQLVDQVTIADIPLDKTVPWITFNIGQVCGVSCIGKFVEIDETAVAQQLKG